MKKGTVVNFSTQRKPVRMWGLGTVLEANTKEVRLEIDLTRFDWEVVPSKGITPMMYNTVRQLRQDGFFKQEKSRAILTLPRFEVWEHGLYPEIIEGEQTQRHDLEMDYRPTMRWALAEYKGCDDWKVIFQSLDAVEAASTGKTYEDVPYICPSCEKPTTGSYWGGTLYAKCKPCDIYAFIDIKIRRKTPEEVMIQKAGQTFLFGVQP